MEENTCLPRKLPTCRKVTETDELKWSEHRGEELLQPQALAAVDWGDKGS